MLTLYFHPFSSFCQKVLTALYEADIAFEPVNVNLGDPAERRMLTELWAMSRFPVLRDGGTIVPESTVIIEHLARRFPAAARLVPAHAEQAAAVRRWDRFFDLDVQLPMQKIVGDRLRPAESRDPFGVEEARTRLRTAYALLDRQAPDTGWWTGPDFTMADCAAAPALFYADWVAPFGEDYPKLAAYFGRLEARPSFARAVDEARPYRGFFPR